MGMTIQLSAQNDLCYSKSTKSYIKLGEVNYDELTTSELLSTRIRSSITKEREYLDDNNDLVRTYSYSFEKNFFPDWYVKPDEVVINQHGRYNFFYSTSTIYEGEWEGARFTNLGSGTYQEGVGEFATRRNYFIPHSTEVIRKRQLIKDQLITWGVQWTKRFTVPTQDVLQIYREEGYDVRILNEVITIAGNGISFIYNQNENSTTYISDDGNGNTQTTVKTYKYFEEVDDLLLHTETTSIPKTLSTGDCVVEVTEIIYDDYSNSCGQNSQPELENRSKNEISDGIILYPNPAKERLTISLPDNIKSAKTNITIYNNLGYIIKEFEVSPKEKETVLEVNNYPPGMYQCIIQLGDNHYIKSFIKL